MIRFWRHYYLLVLHSNNLSLSDLMFPIGCKKNHVNQTLIVLLGTLTKKTEKIFLSLRPRPSTLSPGSRDWTLCGSPTSFRDCRGRRHREDSTNGVKSKEGLR